MFCINCGSYLGNVKGRYCPCCNAQVPKASQPQQSSPQPCSPPLPADFEAQQAADEFLRQAQKTGSQYPVDQFARSHWQQAPQPQPPQAPPQQQPPQQQPPQQQPPQAPPPQPDNPQYPADHDWFGNGQPTTYSPHWSYMHPQQPPPPAPKKPTRVGKVVGLIVAGISVVTMLGVGGSMLMNLLQKTDDTPAATSEERTVGRTGAVDPEKVDYPGGGPSSYHQQAGIEHFLFSTEYNGNTYFTSDGDVYVMYADRNFGERIRYEPRLSQCIRIGNLVYCKAKNNSLDSLTEKPHLAVLDLSDMSLAEYPDVPVGQLRADKGKVYVINDFVMHEVNTEDIKLTNRSWDLTYIKEGHTSQTQNRLDSTEYLVWNGLLFVSYQDADYQRHHDVMQLDTGELKESSFGHYVRCADAQAVYYVDESTEALMRVPGGTGTPEVIFTPPAGFGGFNRIYLDGEYIYFSNYLGQTELSDLPEMENGIYRVHIPTNKLQGIPIPKSGREFTVFDGWLCFSSEMFHVNGDGVDGSALIGSTAEWKDEDIRFIDIP